MAYFKAIIRSVFVLQQLYQPLSCNIMAQSVSTELSCVSLYYGAIVECIFPSASIDHSVQSP